MRFIRANKDELAMVIVEPVGACAMAVAIFLIHHTEELAHFDHQAGSADHNHPHAASFPAANTAVTVIGDTTIHREYEIRWLTGVEQKLGLVILGWPTANS